MLYHFGEPEFPAGFVGVDFVFVISSFLIGGIRWGVLRCTRTISLRRFFLRGVRWLALAYVLMATVTTVFATLILLPFEFREFGKHPPGS